MDFAAAFKTYGAYIKNIKDAIFKILQSKPGASSLKLGQCLKVENVGIEDFPSRSEKQPC